ncbi:MAG TPA: hypothetical protein VFV91_04460 [Gaiellaceae bacterium]|nr:hypothetical protein [Gaiellaceae bacterium]
MEEDWRLPGAGEFLNAAEFRHKAYEPGNESNDHDHCAFCWRKFMEDTNPLREPDSLGAGYAAVDRPPGEDDYYWVCDECFEDFRDRFGWSVIPSGE